MNTEMTSRRISVYSAIACVLATIGCGPRYQVAEVSGTLKVQGAPADKVRLQFIPQEVQGRTGPFSTGETDSQGKFTLTLVEKSADEVKTSPGAVVGRHRVVLTDLRLAESSTGKGVPIRFDQKYSQIGGSPLFQEVKPGKQTLELSVP
jgi:hypothetical protein